MMTGPGGFSAGHRHLSQLCQRYWLFAGPGSNPRPPGIFSNQRESASVE